MRHELKVQKFLSDQGYPVPRPLFLEEKARVFGGPFLLMEWVPGTTMVDLLLHQWTSILWAPAGMANVHARLHQLPCRGFPRRTKRFLPHSLAALAEAIRDYDLAGLAPGLGWLERHRPAAAAEECIVHLDFHPINLIFDQAECKAVLDWGDAEIGDRHADVAATLTLMQLAPLDLPSLWDRLAAAVGKGILVHEYLRAYRKVLPIDDDRLHYYMAWAALRRLTIWGTWLHGGSRALGTKPSCVDNLHPSRLECMCRGFARASGVAVELA
jgi:aminoglycoside phosphotransferase (APT) family kinase protein